MDSKDLTEEIRTGSVGSGENKVFFEDVEEDRLFFNPEVEIKDNTEDS